MGSQSNDQCQCFLKRAGGPILSQCHQSLIVVNRAIASSHLSHCGYSENNVKMLQTGNGW